MSNRRMVQHRAQRDTNTRENAELKRENDKLKRQVARLRKQLNHDGEEPEESPEVEESSKPACPECKSTELSAITTPSGSTRYACRKCKWKGPQPLSL